MSFVHTLKTPGKHEDELRRFFNDKVSYGGPPIFANPLYCLAFFNRSGSNLLANYLRGTPFFSGFHEQLNFDTVKKKALQWGCDNFPDYIIEATTRFSKGRFVHGFKASVDQLMMLERFGIPRMYQDGMKIIHITRDDLIGQAISYQIASQTKKWSSRQIGIMPEDAVCFDPEKISSLVQAAQYSANAIVMFAEIFDVPRLHVTYEMLVRNPLGVLEKVAEFTQQDTMEWSVKEPDIERQASELNDSFRARYLDYIQGTVLLHNHRTTL